MDRLIYTALSGMRGAMARQTTTANNLANANTTGFRAEMSSASALWVRGPGFETRAPTSQQVVAADMAPGSVTNTGRDLDVAMQGDALLAVQADDGSEAYTRRGDLQVSATRRGHHRRRPSRARRGRPADPAARRFDPHRRRRRDLDRARRRRSEPAAAGRPAQARHARRLAASRRASTACSGSPDGGALPSDPDARLTPHSLEGSNVNTSQTLIDMIEASRSWDMQLQARHPGARDGHAPPPI